MSPPAASPAVPAPPEEAARVAAVRASGVLGAPPEAGLDGLVRLAARLCGTTSAEVNLVDADLLWFVAARGHSTPGTSVAREGTLCAWTILDPDRPLLVADAQADPRFRGNPHVVDGTIRSYAGFPLIFDGQAIGTMCVHDRAPGALDAEQLDALQVLAASAQTQLALRRHVDALSALARTDALTGAANRRAMDEALTRELERAARAGTPVTVVLLDLDRFKDFNDTRGHAAGDRLLQQAAVGWRAALRAGDLLARWGGEEFCVLLADCAGPDGVQVADRLRAAVPGTQTCSAGVAGWDGHEPAAALVARADDALYAAKRAGRDRTSAAPAPPVTPRG